MFEKALRKKLRFAYKGSISTEDLWDLSVEELDGIYKKLRKEQKQSDEESLLSKKTAASATLSLKVDIVKYIVETKVDEVKKRNDAAERRAQREHIKGIIAQKKADEMAGKSVEDLEKMYEELG